MADPLLSAEVLRDATPMSGGNVGELFLLRDESRVLKMVRRDLGDDAVARFRAEIDFQSQIDSAFVPKVLERGEIEGRPFFVMQRHHGETLEARLLDKAPLDVLEVGAGLLRALAAVHAAGVTHRDLKSDNVLVGSSVSLVDFGAASRTRANARAAVQFGSSVCWGPERLQGFDGADVRSDLFAAGLLLYMLLARVHPFAYGTPAWEKLLSSKAPSLRAFCPQRASFDGFFASALAPEMSARFSSAKGMERAWREACARAPEV